MPGHAAGHQSILLRLPETGPVLLAGGACWTRWNQDEMTTPSIVWFVSQYVKSRRRLLELAEREGARWFYTHDPGVFDDLGWVDVHRRLQPEASGEAYTWWSNRGQAWARNVGWRIDYQIATPGLAATARSAAVYKERRFSDHAPLIIDYDLTLP